MLMSKFTLLKPLQQTLSACLSDLESGLLLPNTAGKLRTTFTVKAVPLPW